MRYIRKGHVLVVQTISCERHPWPSQNNETHFGHVSVQTNAETRASFAHWLSRSRAPHLSHDNGLGVYRQSSYE